MSANLTPDYDPDLALTRGKWVNVRGIMRWQGARPVDEPETTDGDIVCSYCDARFWESCKSPDGRATRPHKARTRPRTCYCGGDVESSNYNCADCQKKAASKRLTPEVKIRNKAAELIACPTCMAKVKESCKTSGGNVTAPHVDRLVPRRCECGGRVDAGKRVCEKCRVETAERANDHRHRQTVKAKKEEDARLAEARKIAARNAASPTCEMGHLRPANRNGRYLACPTCARDADRARRRAQRASVGRQDERDGRGSDAA